MNIGVVERRVMNHTADNVKCSAETIHHVADRYFSMHHDLRQTVEPSLSYNVDCVAYLFYNY